MRTFFAIDLPVEYKKQLGCWVEALQLEFKRYFKKDSFRWVRAENLHITLQFLDQLKQDDMAKLLEHVRAEVHQSPAFYLQLGPLEWFPNVDFPHVISLCAAPHSKVAELALTISRGIVASGYAIESRAFRSHLTLARVGRLHSIQGENFDTVLLPHLPEVFVKEVVFFRSELRAEGSLYTKMASIELGGG